MCSVCNSRMATQIFIFICVFMCSMRMENGNHQLLCRAICVFVQFFSVSHFKQCHFNAQKHTLKKTLCKSWAACTLPLPMIYSNYLMAVMLMMMFFHLCYLIKWSDLYFTQCFNGFMFEFTNFIALYEF